MAVLLGLWLCAVEVPCAAHAWPRFLTLRGDTHTGRTDSPARTDRAAAQRPALLFPGKAERAEQARALWQEVEAKGRLSPCWKRSLLQLQAKCTEVHTDDAMRSRLALFMATCDADSDGRVHPSFHCASHTPPSSLSSDGVRGCVQGLSDSAYATFVQYRLHADVLCAYLQEELYQERTEAAVTAMLQQMEGSADALAALRDSETEMFLLAKDTQALQREARGATVALQQELASLHHGQATSLQALRTAAGDLLETSSRTDAALTHLHAHVQEAAAEALASVQALQHQSLRQFAAVEEQTRGVVHLMEQVDQVQRLLTRQSFSWHRVLCVLGCVMAVLVATSVPRTAAARLPALALTLLGTAGAPVLQWWFGQQTWLLLRTGLWQCVCAAWTVCVVGGSAYRYTPPEVWQRRLLREEAQRLWRELRSSMEMTATTATTALQQQQQQQPSTPLESASHSLVSLPFKSSWSVRACTVTSSGSNNRSADDQRFPSPSPSPLQLKLSQRPLSIAASPQQSDDEAVAPTKTPVGTPICASPAPSPEAAEVRCATTPPQRKRGRPPAGARRDDEHDVADEAKVQRVEVSPKPRKSTPANQSGTRRINCRTPKKKG